MTKKSAVISYEVPMFDRYVVPRGFLSNDIACHALFRYFISAHSAMQRYRDQVTLEGDPDIIEPNYKALFMSWAQAYGVAPERMVKFWINVDLQADQLGMTRMPKGDKYRFDEVPELRSQ